MAVVALKRTLAAICDRAALRRAVAIVCAVMFLATGLAHTLHHFDAAPPIATSHIELGAGGDSPELPKQAVLQVEHCFVCTMIVLPSAGQSLFIVPVAADRAVAPPSDVRPHPPATELRPPIFAV